MRNQSQSESQTQHDHHTKMFYELSSLVLNIISGESNRRPRMQQITPAGFASLLLGVSLALMLCGSVTFFIGFFLMPWVLGLVMFLYFVGMVSTVSMIGRAVFCYGSQPASPRKDVPSWKLL